SNHLLGAPGAFKTAHPGELTLQPLPDSGFGSTSNLNVAAKHIYHTKKHGKVSSKPPKFLRYPPPDEIRHSTKEGQALYWATSLHMFTYTYINKVLGKAPAPPPFNIPQLQWVRGGIAFTIQQDGRRGGCYIIEELVDSSKYGPFIKYIHNSSATPVEGLSASETDIALFLCFTQHVQWNKTGGQVFISDFQGAGPFLSDPQIMTHPQNFYRSVGNIFCDGNVPELFDQFPNQHTCNKYCDWFDLTSHPPTPMIAQSD
ncbi:hypothetical protein BD410DRAFT_728351, partial [Rickenella mellea]